MTSMECSPACENGCTCLVDKSQRAPAPKHPGGRRYPAFFRIGKNYYNRQHILSVKSVPARSGKDNVMRDWVVVISAEAAANSNDKYREIWTSREEAAGLFDWLEEYGAV